MLKFSIADGFAADADSIVAIRSASDVAVAVHMHSENATIVNMAAGAALPLRRSSNFRSAKRRGQSKMWPDSVTEVMQIHCCLFVSLIG